MIDDQNLLACLCFIQETTILFEDDFIDCLEIESLSNSPWNTIKYPLYEKRKGAATSLIEGIINVARNKGLSEVLKLFAVPEEKSFYQRLGFVETNGSGEMILNSNAVAMFLLDLDQKLNSSTFD